MFEIGKIQGVGPGLCPVKLILQLQDHREQRAHIPRGFPEVVEDPGRGRVEDLAKLLHGLFAPVPDGLQFLGQLRRGIVPDAGDARKRNRKAGRGLVPALFEAGFQKAERPRRLGEALFIGAADLFLGLHVRERFLHPGAPEFDFRPGILQEFPAPGRQCGAAVLTGKFRGLFLRPALRPGVALHGGMKLQHEIGQARVVSPRPDPVRQAQEVFRPAFVAAVQHPLQSGYAQALALLLLQDAEGGRDPQHPGVLAENRSAEGVDRADLGAAAEQDLAAQMRVARVPSQTRGDRVGNAGAQFARGGAGEGDDQEAVDVLGPGVGALRVHVFHQPFSQDAGFSAARAGGDQDAAAAAADGLLL